MSVLKDYHTRVCGVGRNPGESIQVFIWHGHYPLLFGLPGHKASPARQRAQMLWVRRRLFENGDDSVLGLGTYECHTARGETCVTLSGENMKLAT